MSFTSLLESLEVRRFMSAGPVAGPDLSPTAGSSIVVPLSSNKSAPKPTEGGLALTEVANTKFTAKLGEFTYKTVDQAFNAVINWGDGTKSDGTLVGSYATGEYYVQGTHGYTQPGTYKVDVKIYGHLIGSPNQSSSPLAQFTSVITATPLKPGEGGVSLTRVAGEKFTARVGEVTVKVIDLALNAVINWGDGTQSDGTLVGSYATGEYYIQGMHTYAYAGTFKVDTKVFGHPVGSPIHGTSPLAEVISVIKAIAPTNGGVTLTEAAVQKFTAGVATFKLKTVDESLNAVIDWGDGITSAGTLDESFATGKYSVEGTHTYGKTGFYEVDVKIFARPVGSPIQPASPLIEMESVIQVFGAAVSST